MSSPQRRRRFWRGFALAVLALIVIVAFGIWFKFFRQEPQSFASAEEWYKYGSIGTEEEEGLPYWVWLILPRMFPEFLPGNGGYRSLGVAWEEGHETPVGFSKRTIGFPRLGINCAVCHTATYRTGPDEPTVVVPTGPSVRFDSQGYLRFMTLCASDPRFNADNILREISYNVELSWLDKLLYRFVIIPRTREGLLQQRDRYAWTYHRPRWGPGRIDPFNPVKFNPRLLNIDPTHDMTIGNSDMQPLWNKEKYAGYSLHWDGLNNSLTEVVLSGAIGDGTTPKSLPLERLKKMENYLKTKPAPKYPFYDPRQRHPELVEEGELVFKQLCASCHAFGGKETGTVLAIERVGTDRHRLDMWTEEAARKYNAYAEGYSWDFDAFVKTNGYVSVPLDGLWLRAPYLHNGSVPTLEDLLEPASQRPDVFYRGYDVYNRARTGFIDLGPNAEKEGFKYETREKGNSNQGHEGTDYGTGLPQEKKRALVEYLKTL